MNTNINTKNTQLPPFVKLVTWPDEYTASTLIFHSQEPKCCMRLETTTSGLRIRLIACEAGFLHPQEKDTRLNNLTKKIAQWLKTDSSTIEWDLNIEGTPLPPIITAYEPTTGTIKIINTFQLREISKTEFQQPGVVNHFMNQYHNNFIKRHTELHTAPTSKIPPSSNKPKNTGLGAWISQAINRFTKTSAPTTQPV
jgi:hypothetical protein